MAPFPHIVFAFSFYFFTRWCFFLQILELRLISSCNLYSLEEWCQQHCIIHSGICSLITGEEVEKIYKKILRKPRKITAHVGSMFFLSLMLYMVWKPVSLYSKKSEETQINFEIKNRYSIKKVKLQDKQSQIQETKSHCKM